MPITELLVRNATYFKNDVALVEINPDVKNIPLVTWREYSLIESGRGGSFRKQMTWGEFDRKANRFIHSAGFPGFSCPAFSASLSAILRSRSLFE